MKTQATFFYNICIVAVLLASDDLHAFKKQSRFKKNKEETLENIQAFTESQRSTIAELPVTCVPTFDLHMDKLSDEDRLLCTFLDTITFTQEGVKNFFENTFNQKEYGKMFLPHNFSHLQQFLEYGSSTSQSIVFYDGVFRLFIQKFKNAFYIDSDVYAEFLDTHKTLFTSLFPAQPSIWQSIKKTLWDNLSHKFASFKEDPVTFLDDVSQEIEKQISVTATTPEKTRQTLMRLFTTTIDKLAWVASDQYNSWKTFRSIGDSISYLHEQGVIKEKEDCNELYWALIERYCYFLELNGSMLNLDACHAIKQDLLTGKLPWLSLKESEEHITNKAERIAQAIIETEAKVLAMHHEGHLTEFLPIKSIR